MTTLNDLVSSLRAKIPQGITAEDHLILRSLEIAEIRAKLEALLALNYSLIKASAVASKTPNLGSVLFHLNPPPGSATLAQPGILATFELLTNRFVSVSEPLSVSNFLGAHNMGALPFALATPSFSRAAAVPTNDPAYQRNRERGEAFRAKLGARSRVVAQVPVSPRAMPKFSSGTSVGCYEDTAYNTNESYDTNGTTDYHVVTDYSRDWVIDDIVNDDQPGSRDALHLQASSRTLPKFSSGTSVGCYEDTAYNTNESYDTNGTTDYHVVTDYCKDWVIDDIVNDDQPAQTGEPLHLPASSRSLPKFSSGTSVGCYEDTAYNTNESYDTNGTTDYHVVTDYSRDWVIDDIVNDDQPDSSGQALHLPVSPRALPKFSSGTSVGCYEDTAYNTNESYDTNGTTDYHVVTDYSRDWVIDDITNDDES